MNCKFLFFLTLTALFIGCNSGRSTYTNGIIFWCSANAFGFGYGEYFEVIPGGSVYRSSTNDVAAIFGDARDYHASVVDIDNRFAATNAVQKIGE
jgi:hypothetical protein